jgi:uncharacterized protein (TIGR03790 family)
MWIRLSLIFLILVMTPAPGMGLNPNEVLVIANRNAAKSQGLAAYYMKKREIPASNLVLLWITDQETCTRQAYTQKAVPPVQRFLAANKNIRALVTMFGVPLKIADTDPGDDSDTGAAFDSELALVKLDGTYPVSFWQPNPFYPGFKEKPTPFSKDDVMMVSRLDGSSADVVKRIIDDSLEAEKKGLSGNACFDARWQYPENDQVTGYAFYDRSLHNTARFHKENNVLPVILNDTEVLFSPGDCPETVLYCGWYSLGNYIHAFEWVKGSVGYHIASTECTTLKTPGSRVWCKNILDHGAAATIGPVGEPYVQAFPVPELFFNFLSEGYLTLAESYMVSLPFLSWKMVLVGDPLYRLNIRK